MRPTIKAESLIEQLGLWLGRVPVPAAEAFYGMGIARVVMAGVRLGIFRELARAPLSETDLASACGVQAGGLRLLLRCLASLGHVTEDGEVYRLSRRSRRWLDPDSPTCIAGFLELNYDQWEWWSKLEKALRDGQPIGIHDHPAGDPYWRRYISGLHEFARLTAPEVARRIRLPRAGARILDLGGGHGGFAAELCRQNPGATALVVDLPGGAQIGREITAAAGLSDRVEHIEGDITADDLPRGVDAVLLFQIVHHFSAEQNRSLIRRAWQALNPAGAVAVLDYFDPPPGHKPDSGSFLGLHFYLTSGVGTYSAHELMDWLSDGGFEAIRSARLKSIPLQELYQARKPVNQ